MEEEKNGHWRTTSKLCYHTVITLGEIRVHVPAAAAYDVVGKGDAEPLRASHATASTTEQVNKPISCSIAT